MFVNPFDVVLIYRSTMQAQKMAIEWPNRSRDLPAPGLELNVVRVQCGSTCACWRTPYSGKILLFLGHAEYQFRRGRPGPGQRPWAHYRPGLAVSPRLRHGVPPLAALETGGRQTGSSDWFLPLLRLRSCVRHVGHRGYPCACVFAAVGHHRRAVVCGMVLCSSGARTVRVLRRERPRAGARPWRSINICRWSLKLWLEF